MPRYTSIPIAGYGDTPVPNTFIMQDRPTDHLALVFPGQGYRATMPVLYYPSRALLNRGADVLWVEYDYRAQAGFGAASMAERQRRLAEDALAATRAGLAQRDYGRVTLVGKSLGTLAMGIVISSLELPIAEAIWLTPLVRQSGLRQQIAQAAPRSLFIIGTADPHYDQASLQEVVTATGGQAMIIPGANHSLEIDGDVLASLEAMRRLVAAVEAFLG